MSMTVNANVNNVSWETLLSPLGDVKKTDSVEGRQNFTITTNVDGAAKTVTVSVPEDLEIPESVDQTTLEGLVDKLKATGLGFTDEQVAQMKGSIAKIFDGSTQAATTVSAQSKGKILFDLYALMALMIEVAQSQRDAAREMRTAENLQIQKAIQNQADDQRAAAMVGMIVGVTCGIASAVVSAGLMIKQSTTAATQSKIMAQSGADAAKMHSAALQNTDTAANAQAKLDQVSAAVGNEVASAVNNDFNAQLVDDQVGNLSANLESANARVANTEHNLAAKNQELNAAQETLAQKTQAKNEAQANYDAKKAPLDASREKQRYITAEMSAGRVPDPARLAEFDARMGNMDVARQEFAQAETALNSANQELTTAQNDVNLKQNAVQTANTELTNAKAAQTQAKADYVKTVQDVAAQYEEKYQTAVDRLGNPPPGADKAQLKADVAAAKAKMEMAFAKEAQLLTKDGAMTPSEQKDLVATARARVDVTTDRAMRRSDFKSAEFKMTMLQGINNINQSVGQVTQSTAQNLSAIRSAEATRQQADAKKEEEMLDQTKDLFAQEQKLIDQVVQLFTAVIQAESQSMRDAIQA